MASLDMEIGIGGQEKKGDSGGKGPMIIEFEGSRREMRLQNGKKWNMGEGRDDAKRFSGSARKSCSSKGEMFALSLLFLLHLLFLARALLFSLFLSFLSFTSYSSSLLLYALLENTSFIRVTESFMKPTCTHEG